MTTISATEARSNFSELLGRVAYGKERVTIERRGRPLAVLLPIEDLARLEARAGAGPAGASDILSAVADNIPGTIYQRVHHPDGREEYSYVSPGTREIFGVEPEAMFSDPATLDRAIHPEDRELRVRAIAESARALSTYDVQYRVFTPTGETKWLHVIARPERRADGAITWTGLTLDITTGKRTEAALRQNEALLRQAAEMSNLGHWVWNEVEDRCLSCSETLARMNGVTADEYLAKYGSMDTLLLDIHPDDRERYARTIAAAKAEARGYDIEYRDAAPDGGYRYLRERSEPILDSNGNLVRSVGTLQDVTQYKQAEAALRESEARLRDLIEGSIEGILIHRDHKPLLVNEAWAAIHGYTVEEVRGIDSVVDLVSPVDREQTIGYRDARLRGEEAPVRYEYRALRKDGSEIWLENLVRAVDWDGAPAIQTVVIDITERKSAEAALERARDELERRVEERTRELHVTNRALEEEVGTRKEVEERLRESERDLRNLIEGSVQGVLIVTKDRAPRFANQACAEIFGFESPAEILALDNTLGLIAPYEVARLDQLRNPHFADQEAPISYEFDGVRKDGATIRLQCMARAMTWRGERVAQITLYDITERERAERALRESEERLRQATRLARIGYYVWDVVEDRCTFCSEEHARIHGLTPEQYIARASQVDGDFSLTHPDDRETVRKAMKALREGEMFEMEYRVVTPQGEARHVREIAQPVFDEAGRVVREIGACLDISEMKRAETLLARAMDVSPTVFALFDADDHLVIANRQYRDQYETEAVPIVPGIVFEDIIHAFAAKVGIGGTEEETETWVAKRLSRREHPAKGFEYRRGDGDWIEVSDHLLDDGSIFTVGLITTERKQSEERLRQAQKMEAVGQLTGGVAHDFNNLLAVIVGNAELLGERLGVADHQVAAVLRAAGRGAELTQRLLAFSRRQPLKPQAIDLAARVAGMTELLTRTLGATIEISVASTPGLWRASADPGQLESALLNLAINARDAMPEGGRLSISSANASLEAREIVALLTGQAPEAALEAAPEAVTGEPGDPGDYVVLSVSDTGAGMSPAVLARVFEPFFTTKDVGQGSGLGLSMVYGFARQSGGFAAIESAPGRGTTVRLYLPRAEAEAPALEVSAPGARNRAGQLPCGHGETVLLLEDARDVRELASVLLEDLGYRVLAAAEAAEAGALLAENPGVDLLLTDVTLPGGRSGPDFAETARRHDPALKVLFMSGYPTEALMQRAGSLGRDTPLLAKPFRKAALAKAVRNALDDGDKVHGTE